MQGLSFSPFRKPSKFTRPLQWDIVIKIQNKVTKKSRLLTEENLGSGFMERNLSRNSTASKVLIWNIWDKILKKRALVNYSYGYNLNLTNTRSQFKYTPILLEPSQLDNLKDLSANQMTRSLVPEILIKRSEKSSYKFFVLCQTESKSNKLGMSYLIWLRRSHKQQ